MLEHIFDTHSHYTDSSFDADRDELFRHMHSNGVEFIMLAATDCNDSEYGLEISSKYDFIYNSVGIHPELVDNVADNYIDILKELAMNPKVKAIGEIGLDYHYPDFDSGKQKEIFRNQIILAKELGLPVIVHSRDSSEDTMKILHELKPEGVLHCFSGSPETAAEIVNLGMYIGFTGVLTFKNAKKPLQALERVPLERLLLETDCPYMAPEPWRGKRCNSLMIESTAKKAAQIKGVSVQGIIDITNSNARKLFRI